MQLTKALVIGSVGNIGKPLVKYLKTLGYSITRIDHKPNLEEDHMMADIRNIRNMLPAFDWKPDVVFYLAAEVSRVTCEQASLLASDVNLTGTQNVLNLTKRYIKHFKKFPFNQLNKVHSYNYLFKVLNNEETMRKFIPIVPEQGSCFN